MTTRKTGLTRCFAIFLAVILLFPVFSMRADAVNGSQAGARGIDVSKYQGNVDWNAVRASGVTFAFIKAYRKIKEECPIELCASHGLLSYEQLKKLKRLLES